MARLGRQAGAGAHRSGATLRAALATGFLAWCAALSAQPVADRVTILVYDASGSMWAGMPGGTTRVEVAREVIGGFFSERDHRVPIGVIAYGHNRRGDCTDIEVVAPVAVHDASMLSARLNRINPVGMTPLTDALARAAGQIPSTAEAADIILVTDGLETCDADPCALAAGLAAQGIRIRAHVVGFGLSDREAEAMSCVADATGGMLLTPQTGQELADALHQVAQAGQSPVPPVETAFFHIGPHAEAGHTYLISYRGTAAPDHYLGFTGRGEGRRPAGPSFGVVGGAGTNGSNPVRRTAPEVPGGYDLVLVAHDNSIVARQPIEVVPPSNGFAAVDPVEPGQRFAVSWRGPDQVGQRIVIARPDDPPGTYGSDWGHSLHAQGRMWLRAPDEPGVYELRYLSAN